MFLWRFLVTIVHYIFIVLTIGVLDSFLLVIIIECQERDAESVFVSQQLLQQITSGKVPER